MFSKIWILIQNIHTFHIFLLINKSKIICFPITIKKTGGTLLHFYCSYGIRFDKERFIQECDNIDPLDNNGKTPLFCSANIGDFRTVKYLLKHGADIEKMVKFIGEIESTITERMFTKLSQIIMKHNLITGSQKKISELGNRVIELEDKIKYKDLCIVELEHKLSQNK